MPRYTDKQIEDALRKTKGMVYVAAKQMGCSPTTIKKRLEARPALREVLEAEHGLTVDTAELKLFQAIQNGDAWAIQFFLKTQGRGRGYVERQELDLSGQVKTAIEYVNDWRDGTNTDN